MTTLIPAYGRDYRSKKEVIAAWESGKDFIIADVFDIWDGKPCNLESARDAGMHRVNIRYKQLTQICVVTVK